MESTHGGGAGSLSSLRAWLHAAKAKVTDPGQVPPTPTEAILAQLEDALSAFERSQVEHQRTGQQLAATLRAIGDGVITTDALGRITFMNGVAESLTGWSATDASQQPLSRVLRLIGRSSRETVESPVDVVLREGVAVTSDNQTVLVRRDGTELGIDDSAAPVRDAKGELVGVVLELRDVSEKRRAEERAEYLAEASEQILEASLDLEVRLSKVVHLAVPRLADLAAIDMVAEDGTLRRLAIAHVDPSKIALVSEIDRRYPPDLQATRGAPKILQTRRSEIVPAISDEMLAAGARDEEHLRLLRALGPRSYIGVPLIARGRALGVLTFVLVETRRTYGPEELVFAEDLARRAAVGIENARLHTESEAARAKAEAAEQRFRALAEAIPEIIWSTSPDGEHEYLSPRWYEYTGQRPEDGLEARWVKALHPDDHEPWRQSQERAIRSGEAWQMEYRLRRADDVYRWHIGRSVPQGEGGRIVKWYGAATDIDEQKRAIRARDELLATVSHDLRNPLGAIVLSLNLLQHGEKNLPKLTGAIQRATTRMNKLISDLLDINAIESGQLSIVCDAHPMGSLVSDAVSLHRPLAEQKGVVLVTSGEQDTLVHCDRDRILQVFSNLLGNALKFTPASGMIRISYDVAGEDARFAISDMGPGIPARRLSRVFDRFWRDKSRANAGTGLGLAISKGIVAQHGGKIWAESREGEGSTFVFTLPLDGSGCVRERASFPG